MVEGLASLGELNSQILSTSKALFWDISPLQCPRFCLPYFTLLFDYYSCVCSYLFLRPCCFHARGILCGIHTSCDGIPVLYSPFQMFPLYFGLVRRLRSDKRPLNLVYNNILGYRLSQISYNDLLFGELRSSGSFGVMDLTSQVQPGLSLLFVLSYFLYFILLH